jgi:predicted DNA-binding transcriptional regulator AlpA
MLDVSELTLYRMRKNGTGPDWCRIGTRVLYDLESVNAFVQERMVRRGEVEARMVRRSEPERIQQEAA